MNNKYRASNALGMEFRTVDDAMAWLGDGGMVFLWTPNVHCELHADLHIGNNGKTDVTLYDGFGAKVADVTFDTTGHAFGFARSYVIGASSITR